MTSSGGHGDVRSWLANARTYSLVQNLLGARRVRRRLLEDYVQPAGGERILDLGCGPGDIVALLPPVDYTGIDLSPAYVRAAQRRYGARARFLCADVRELPLESLGRFDVVIAVGVMHHLSDREAAGLAGSAAALLKAHGRFVTLDGALSAGQPRVAGWLARRDRGQMVRAPEAYRELIAPHFRNVEVFVHHDLARVPYTHAVLVSRVLAAQDAS